MLLFSFALWILALLIADTTTSDKIALIFSKASIIGPSFSVYYLYMLSFYFPHTDKTLKKLYKTILLIPALIIIFLSPTSLNIIKASVKPWGAEVEPGILYASWLVYFVVVLILSVINLVKKSKSLKGIYKLQLKYLFFSLILTAIWIVITNVILVILGYSRMSVLGPPSMIIFAGFTTYAIIKHLLMDIRIILQKSLVYSALLAVCVLVYILVVYAIGLLAGEYTVISAGVTVVVLVFTVPVLKRKFEKWTDKIFFKAPIDHQTALKKVNYIFSSETNLVELIKKTTSIIKELYKVSSASFLFCSKSKGNKCVQYVYLKTGLKKRRINSKSPLIKYFQNLKNFKILLLEDLEIDVQVLNIKEKEAKELIKEMKNLGVSLCFSVVGKEGFLGIVCVGEKLNEEPFFLTDVEWFDIISKQCGLAIERALFYENLEELVEERTAQLKRANSELKRISDAKTEFVSVASHQLKTPLSIVKGTLSLLLEEKFGPLSKEQKNYINKVFVNNEKLINLINQLLNVSRIESGRISLNIAKNDLNKVVKDSINSFKHKIDEKGLKIKYKSKPGFEWFFDKELISEVIINLIDNSIKYTEDGFIEIEISKENDQAIFKIKDTGMGIDKDDQGKLFQRFVRGKTEVFVRGTGLGLYIIRKTIEAHGGKVWVKSDGEGTGSEFGFSLPIK